jgi:hypothetical protein
MEIVFMNRTVLNFDEVVDHTMKQSRMMKLFSSDQIDLLKIIKDLPNLKV